MDYIENIIINKLDNVNKSATSFMDTIGSEIRLKRNRMNLTLKALTDNTCSVSYLSKIEHNKIEPNMMILRELCGRLKINDEQFEQLLNSVKIGESMIKYYYLGNEEELEQIYIQNKELKNVSSKIIQGFYYLYKNDISAFEQLYSKIYNAVSVLNDRDTINFGLLFSIYMFKTFNYKTALNVLRSIKDVSNDIYYNALREEIYSKILFDLNNDEFLKSNRKVVDNNWNLKLLDKIIKNKELEEKYIFRRKVINLLTNNSFRNETNYDRFLKLAQEGKKLFNDSLIYDIVIHYISDKSNFLDYLSNLELTYNGNLEYHLICYFRLSLTNYDESINYLYNTCLPLAYKQNDYLYSLLFNRLLTIHYVNNTRYKRCIEIDEQLFEHYMDLKD